MAKSVKALIREGDELEMPPRSREERMAFSRWLSSALEALSLSTADLAKRTRVRHRDIRAMVEDESNGTPKEDRTYVCDFLLETLSNTEEVAPVDPSDRLNAVFDGAEQFTVLFSPRDNLRRAVVEFIRQARREIRVQAWDLSCREIGSALMANTRASRIEIIVSSPRNEALSPALQELSECERVILLSDPDRKNHNKTIVVDRKFVLTGSLNFNYGSGRHDENVLITSQAKVVAAYWQDFEGKRNRCDRLE